MTEIKLEPFATNQTDVAAAVWTQTGRMPTLEKPASLFDRKVRFVFEDGRGALNAAESYIRDDRQFRIFFQNYQLLKNSALNMRPSANV